LTDFTQNTKYRHIYIESSVKHILL